MVSVAELVGQTGMAELIGHGWCGGVSRTDRYGRVNMAWLVWRS